MRVVAPSTFGLALVTGATVVPAAMQTPPMLWEGVAIISDVADCSAKAQSKVVDSYTVVYRPQVNGSTETEGLTFSTDRSSAYFVPTSGSFQDGMGTFNSTTIFRTASINQKVIVGEYTLNINGLQPSPTKFVTMVKSSLKNFFASGCTVTFSASLTQRVSP
jgi:hypothetical protein